MNLVIINCTYDTFTPANSGAIGTWVYEVARSAEADGVVPLIVTRSSNYPQHDRPNTVFVDYPRLPSWWVMGKLFGLQKRLAGWVRPRQGAYCARVADAIDGAGAGQWPIILHNDMELAASLRHKFPKARIIHFSHNSVMTTPRYRDLFPRVVDVPLAVSDYTSRWNENFYQLPAGSVKTIYNGVDIEAFIPRQDHATSQPILGFVGKLDHAKGPDIMLKAALRLAARTREFSVQIVGRRLYDKEDPDDYERQLQHMAADLGDAGVDCRFTGWVNRKALPVDMGNAHIHITPSRVDEAFGLTTIEAMACGSAVIGSNTGGTAEVIGDAGFLFEKNDDARLADLLEPLIRDPALRADYGRRARARRAILLGRNLAPAEGAPDEMTGLLFINTMTDTFTPTNSFSTGTIVWELCRAARRDGIAPWVMSSDSSHAPYDWKNLILVPAPRKPRGWLATKLNNQFLHRTGWVHPGQSQWCRRVVAAIKRHRLQHLPMVLTNDIELAVFLRRHFPKAFILHQAQNQNGAKKMYHGTFARSVDVASAVSDYCREWNEQYYGIAPGRMHTWLNGVDSQTYRPAPEPPPGPPVINFHSRLDWCKGADVLLKAALIVAAKTTRFRIQLVGRRSNWQLPPDWFDREIESLCAQIAAAGVSVRRTGWTERARLPDVLRQAHIHVTPSRWPEPFGLTTLEGMACGLATIASATGGSPQVVGNAGLLFENENAGQLAQHLERLVVDSEFRLEYGRRARKRAEELTWDKAWDRLKQLIGLRSPGECHPQAKLESQVSA